MSLSCLLIFYQLKYFYLLFYYLENFSLLLLLKEK